MQVAQEMYLPSDFETMNPEDQAKESGVYESAKLIYSQISIPLSPKYHEGQFRSMRDPPRSIRSQPDEGENYQLTHTPRETTNTPIDAEVSVNQGDNIHNQTRSLRNNSIQRKS